MNMRTQIFLFIANTIRTLPVVLRIPVRFVVNLVRIATWWLSVNKIPPPYAYKIFTLMIYAMKYKTNIFVETGTYNGDTLDSLRNSFNKLYSIELDDDLCKRANRYFRNSKKIKIYHGDSARVLPALLPKINGRVLFWLDAHYSGEGTAKGDRDTPIMRELSGIHKYIKSKPVILVDDARLFNGTDSYPKLKWFVAHIKNNWKGYKVEVRNDVIRIIPC